MGSRVPAVQIHTFGRFLVVRNGQPVVLSHKAHSKPFQLLKTVLALRAEGVHADTLTEALWPDSDGDRANASFRTTLHRLRTLIGADSLVLEEGRLRLNPETCESDCFEFERLSSQLEAGERGAKASLDDSQARRLLQLYRGPFLEGEFDPVDVLSARERYHARFIRSVMERGTSLLEAGRHRDALDWVSQALEIDDGIEDFHRLLIEIHAHQDQFAAAAAAYERCASALRARAGAEPSPALQLRFKTLHAAFLERPSATVQEAPSSSAGPPLPDREPGRGTTRTLDSPASTATHGIGIRNTITAILASFARALSLPRPRATFVLGAALLLILLLAGDGPATREARLAASSPFHPVSIRPKPVVAVMPFRSLNGESGLGWLGDGISDDLVLNLANLNSMRVIDRMAEYESRFGVVSLSEIRERLGAQYLVEGSVRAQDGHVRVNASITETRLGQRIWAERFDRPLRDWLEIQMDIARSIALALNVEAVEGDQARAWQRGTDSQAAYEYFLRSRRFSTLFARDTNARGIELLSKSVQIDPRFALAHAYLGLFHLVDARYGWSPDVSRSGKLGVEHVQRALALDPNLADAHAIMSAIHRDNRQHDLALAEARKAVALAPNQAEIALRLALNLAYAGEPVEALYWLDRARTLSPVPTAWASVVAANALRQIGRYDDAIAELRNAERLGPNEVFTQVFFTATLVEAGRAEEASLHAREILRRNPEFTVDEYARRALPFKAPEQEARVKELLRRAGLR